MTTPSINHPIYPCIWFNHQGKEAAELYCSLLPDTQIITDDGLVVNIRSGNEKLMFLNGGPMFTPNPSISFFVYCDSEAEIDRIWAGLSENGKVMMPLDTYPWAKKYGWLADRFQVNWQLIFVDGPRPAQKISPALLFTQENAGKAAEAIEFFTSVFQPSAIHRISRYEAGDGDIEGHVKQAQFYLGTSLFNAMDSSGPHNFQFTEGVSLVVECDDQATIDYYWERLTDGGAESQCGWLKDRYGISWQIIPKVLFSLMTDPAKAGKAMAAFMKMVKFDIAELEKAANS